MGDVLVGFSRASTIATGSFVSLGGGKNTTTGETTVANPIRSAGTFSNFQARVDALGSSRAIRLRVNGANGTLVINPTNTTAGTYSDTTHSDHLNVGDTVNASYSTSASSSIFWLRAVFRGDSEHATLWAGGNISPTTFPCFFPIVAGAAAQTTESNAQYLIRAAGTWKGLGVGVQTNNSANTSTFKSRINAADGAQTFTVAGNTTGSFQDTTHSDSVAAGDLLAINLSGTSAGSTPQMWVFSTFVSNALNVDMFAGSASTRAANASNTFTQITGEGSFGGTEVNNAFAHGFSGVASNLRVRISANTYTGTLTVRLRKNTANANQTFTVAAGATGTFEDSTNVDGFQPTDTIAIAFAGGTANSITLLWSGLTETTVPDGVGAASGTGAAAAVGAAIFAGVGSATGAGAAAATGSSTAASTAAAAGVGGSAVVGASTAAASASATGVGAAAAVGTGIIAGVGAASGTGAAAAVGATIFAGVGNAAGVGVGSAASGGTSTQSGDGAATGTGTASAAGIAIFSGVGAAAGTGAAAGVGRSTAASTASASGTGTAAAVAPTYATAAASGTGTGTGVGASTAAAIASAAGSGTATGVSSSAIANGTATGTGTAAGVGAATAAAVASASGTGAASGVGGSTAASAGAALGVGAAIGAGGETIAAVASAAGVGTALGITQAGTVTASASGHGAAQAVGVAIFSGIAIAAGHGVAAAIGRSTAASVAHAAGLGDAHGVNGSTRIRKDTGPRTTPNIGDGDRRPANEVQRRPGAGPWRRTA